MDLQKIPFKQSPNYQKGRTSKLDTIVMHSMCGYYLGSIAWILPRFLNKKSKVSAHYLVSSKGEITQMVRDEDTAWHCYGYNSRSIGIELEDKKTTDKGWVVPMIWDTSAKLVAALCKKHNISVSNIKCHNDADIQDYARKHNPSMIHKDPAGWGVNEISRFRERVDYFIKHG